MSDTDARLHDVMVMWLAESDNEDTAGLRAYTLAHIRKLETALAAIPNPSGVPALVAACRVLATSDDWRGYYREHAEPDKVFGRGVPLYLTECARVAKPFADFLAALRGAGVGV